MTLVTLGLLTSTLGDPGITWDEGITIRRAERIGEWFAELLQPRELSSRLEALRHELIVNQQQPMQSYWPFVWVWEGHPPFYAVVADVGWLLSHRWLEPLAAYRFGAALLFSLTAGIVYLMLSSWYGTRAAIAGSAALVFFPRMFAHAHLVSYDVPVLCFWLLATAAFLKAWATRKQSQDKDSRQDNGIATRTMARLWTVLFGFLLGLAFLTKFTGWFAVVPLVAWCMLYRDRQALGVLVAGVIVALATFYVLNPPLWHHPVEGTRVFFEKNLHRGKEAGLNIAVTFFGRNYDLNHSLPWYNTLVWSGITLPLGTLLLVLAGITRVAWGAFRDRVGVLLLLSAGLLLVVRALPGTPPHDGIRLMLPSFAFLTCLAGVGAATRGCVAGTRACADSHCRDENVSNRMAASRSLSGASWPVSLLIGVLLAGSAFSTWLYHPHQLSHYNLLIGGLPGAVRTGMEPTYYWDGMTDDVLEWINENTPAGQKVWFSTSQESWGCLRQWGKLEPEVLPPGEYRWYVLQLRSSSYRPPDPWLLKNAQPAFVKRLQDPPLIPWGPFRLDVPLIQIYDFRDYEEAVRATMSPS